MEEEEEIELIEEDLGQSRDRVSKLEEIFAKLAKRFKLNFNPRPRQQNTRNYDVSTDIVSSTSAAARQSCSGVVDQESSDLSVIPPPIEQEEVRFNEGHENESEKEGNASIHVGSASAYASPINGQNEDRMPPTSAAAESCNDIVDLIEQKPYNKLGVNSLPINSATENEEVCQINVDSGRDSPVEDDSSVAGSCLGSLSNERRNDDISPSPAAVERSIGVVAQESYNELGVNSPSNTANNFIEEDRSNSSISSAVQTQKKVSVPKKKSTTTTKSCYLESKTAFVSLKRLSSAQILKEKMALKRNNPSKIPSSKITMEGKQQRWKCPHCPKILSCKSNITRHIRIHTGERPFRCPHCPQATTQASVLRTHIRTLHPESNKNLFSCRICQKKFPSMKILSLHKKKHLKCYFCSHKVINYQEMLRHVRTHTGEKPFNCPHCRYATVGQRDLKQHAKTHERMSFKCGICKMKFKLKKLLRIHVKTHKNYKFRCYFCSELFPRVGRLEKHIVIHTGEYPPNSTTSNRRGFRQTYNYFVN